MPATKTILVTGCSAGGVGYAVALAVAKQGHYVFATARNLAKIPSELTELSTVTTLQLDVTSMESLAFAAKAVSEATEARGARGLDVLVNNAGVGLTTPLLDVDIEQAQRVYDTNVWGSLRAVQAFSDLLIERKGQLVNVCSISTVLHVPWMGVYASSKSALTVMSDTLRLELSPFGVSVITVVLGVVNTAFNNNKLTLELPPSSRYAPILDTLRRWDMGDVVSKGGTAEDAAAAMLPDILGTGSSGQVWRGNQSGFVKFLARWMPEFIVDAVVSKDQGLSELSKIHNS